MERRRPRDSEEDKDNEAFDRIDALLANASAATAELRAKPHSKSTAAAAAMPPVERILGVAEELLQVRVALEHAATMTTATRSTLEHALRDVTQLCDDWAFATARARVDFIREDLDGGQANLKNDITELVRHLRYDARGWNGQSPGEGTGR
jgi:hypothetical protein